MVILDRRGSVRLVTSSHSGERSPGAILQPTEVFRPGVIGIENRKTVAERIRRSRIAVAPSALYW